MKILAVQPLLISLFFPIAHAAEKSPWEFSGAGGLSFTDGNSETLAYSLQFLGSYDGDGDKATIGADYFYSEDGAIKSTDSLKIFGQYNYDLAERTYAGAYGSYFRDSVADIDYRIDTSVLLGYRVIESSATDLSFEAGPGYSWEDRGGSQRDFATMRFVERYEYRFNEVTKFWQSVGITPTVEDFSDYLLDFELGIETRVTDRWSLRTFMKHRLDSTPVAGKGRSDTTIMLGLGYDFNGLPEPDGGGRKSLFPGSGSSGGLSDGWESVAALGFSRNSGNSDSMSLNISWDSEYRSDEREFFFEIAQALQENNGVTSEDQTTSRTQYNHFLNEHSYLGATLGVLRDDQADIDYRITPGLIAGHYVIKNDTTKLAFEAGPAYTFRSIGGVTDNYPSIVAAERFSHKFSSRFSFKQAVEFISDVTDFENHSLLVTSSFDTKISDRMSWRVGGNFSFENQPAAGREKQDISLTSSIAVKF